MDHEPHGEQAVLDAGKQNREDLTVKYKLDQDPVKFQESIKFGQEATKGCLEQLRSANNAIEFGQVVDQEIVGPMRQRFNHEDDDYGDRVAKAYVERTGTKARDEIKLALDGLGIDNVTTRSMFNLLPLAMTVEQMGGYVNQILGSDPTLEAQAQTLFEASRNEKIAMFEEYYKK